MAKPDKSADVLLEALSLALLNWSLRQDRKAGELSGTPASVTSHCDMFWQFYRRNTIIYQSNINYGPSDDNIFERTINIYLYN